MEIIAKVLYGSQNYGLDTPESDMDFKLIVRPDFDDLYCGRNLNEKRATPASCDPNHYSTMDVRQWFELLKKGNINAVEYLFSYQTEVYDDKFWYLMDEAREIYRNKYLQNVWSTYLSSATGVTLNSIKRNGMNKKTLSRAYYYFSQLHYLMNRECIMDYDVWRSNDVTALAREIRFTTTGDTFVKYMTEEQVKNYFSDILKNRFTPNSALTVQMDNLQKKVYNYVKGEILNEA